MTGKPGMRPPAPSRATDVTRGHASEHLGTRWKRSGRESAARVPSASAAPRAQKGLGSFPSRNRRTGTLGEGRFKAALVNADRYLLTSYRYIEPNPN